MTSTRREAMLLAAVGAAAIALPAGAAPIAEPGAEAAFRKALAATADGRLDVDARLAFLMPDALAVADDVPFAMDRAAYADHLRFEAQHWERLEVALQDLKSARHGETAVVTAYYNLRGKPKDAGFRLRAGYCTAVCVRTAAGWQALSLHMAPLSGQILDASPGG